MLDFDRIQRGLSRRRRRSPMPEAPWDREPASAEEDASSRQEGRFLRKLWHSSREQWRRMAVAGVVIWAAYAVLLSPGGTLHLEKLQRRAGRVDREIDRLTSTRDSLQRALAALESGEAAELERVAREQFGFARDNERIYVLPDDEEDRACIAKSRNALRDQGTESQDEGR